MRSFRFQPRLRTLMFVIALLAVVLGGIEGRRRANRRWSLYRQLARRHATQELFYQRLARRFDELAEVERSIVETEPTTDPDRTAHLSQARLLRDSAADARMHAASEARLAREFLRHW